MITLGITFCILVNGREEVRGASLIREQLNSTFSSCFLLVFCFIALAKRAGKLIGRSLIQCISCAVGILIPATHTEKTATNIEETCSAGNTGQFMKCAWEIQKQKWGEIQSEKMQSCELPNWGRRTSKLGAELNLL